MESLVGLTNSTVSGEEDQSPSDSIHGPYSLKEATDGLQFIYNFTDSSYSQSTSTSTDDPFLIHNSQPILLIQVHICHPQLSQ